MPIAQLVQLYLSLMLWVGLGWVIGRQTSASVQVRAPSSIPQSLGKFLYWIGAPIGNVAFLRRADLSGLIWAAPIVAWVAILVGAGLTWMLTFNRQWPKPTQGSVMLAAMVGNTGYLGYPVTLALVGPQYFAWALFYDLAGTTIGAYGLGVVLASHFGATRSQPKQLAQTLLINPVLWSLGLGLWFRSVLLPNWAEQGLQGFAWSMVACSLILIGLRLNQLSSLQQLYRVAISLEIKMVIVPFLLGLGLEGLGIRGAPQLVLVLQTAMPPAFATIILAETFNLDRDLTVTTLAIGSIGLLLTLPIWLWLFG
jgi:malate permease and related proteins